MREPPFKISDRRDRFPEKREYFVSAEQALEAMQRTLAQMKDFREQDVHVLRDVLWPLLPARARRFFRCVKPEQVTIAYTDMVNRLGRMAALLTLWNVPDALEIVQQYHRFAVLPFVELTLREKYRALENAQSFKQKIWRYVYGRILEGLSGAVDNLVHLVVLAWTFAPGIGEPDEETGFYNRYVLGRYCGILDLGHFFNCAAVAYLYGEEEGKKRGEQIERRQRWLREQKWLADWRKQKEGRLGRVFADFLWGFAASADTIEDRSSNWFGIQLGRQMRAFKKNERIIEYFMRAWPRMVRSKIIRGAKKASRWREAWADLQMIAAVWRQVWNHGGAFDIEGFMRKFFEEHHAFAPEEVEKLAPGLLAEIIETYRKLYDSERGEDYAAKKWEIVFPQDLWEKVVRVGWNGKATALPVKVQLKHNGDKVEPYFREEAE